MQSGANYERQATTFVRTRHTACCSSLMNNTVQSRLLEPSKETKIGSKNSNGEGGGGGGGVVVFE